MKSDYCRYNPHLETFIYLYIWYFIIIQSYFSKFHRHQTVRNIQCMQIWSHCLFILLVNFYHNYIFYFFCCFLILSDMSLYDEELFSNANQIYKNKRPARCLFVSAPLPVRLQDMGISARTHTYPNLPTYAHIN